MIRVAILGASGFVGSELLRLCAGHPDFVPVELFGDSQAGQSLDAVHPHLALVYPGLTVERFSPDSLDGIDLVFAALPHGHSQAIAPEVIARGIPIVDLGADFRLNDAAAYEAWYHEPHQAPDPEALPCAARMLVDQCRMPELDVPAMQAALDEAYRNNLY